MSALDLLMRAAAWAPRPLTVRQFAVLLYLRGGGQEFTQVRTDLGLSPPQLTRAADALTGAKLLVRALGKDRRVPTLALTKAGETFVDKVAGAP